MRSLVDHSKKDDDHSKKDADHSKKDDELFHPWLVENKVKNEDNMAKKEKGGPASKLEMPGPGEMSSGAKPSGSQKKTAGKKKSYKEDRVHEQLVSKGVNSNRL